MYRIRDQRGKRSVRQARSCDIANLYSGDPADDIRAHAEAHLHALARKLRAQVYGDCGKGRIRRIIQAGISHAALEHVAATGGQHVIVPWGRELANVTPGSTAVGTHFEHHAIEPGIVEIPIEK